MNRTMLWFGGLLASLVTILGTIFGLTGALLTLLILVPLVRRKDGQVALSGYLTGFGAIWLFLLARASWSGGTLENAGFWTLVGVVPLAAGLGLLATILGRSRMVEKRQGS